MALQRHKALQGYSREHHHELLLVWKIGEGLKKDISANRIIDYCIHNFNEILSPHMEREEKYILTKLPENDIDRIDIINQHNEVREIIEKLSRLPEDKNELLLKLADSIEKHIRFEERVFFPKLQNDYSDEIIKSMQPEEEELKECSTWNDPFWLEEKK